VEAPAFCCMPAIICFIIIDCMSSFLPPIISMPFMPPTASATPAPTSTHAGVPALAAARGGGAGGYPW